MHQANKILHPMTHLLIMGRTFMMDNDDDDDDDDDNDDNDG